LGDDRQEIDEMKIRNAWQRRAAAAVVAVGVSVGVLVVAPSAALATSYVSCTPFVTRSSSGVAANPTYHDIYFGVTASGGTVQYTVKDINSGAIIRQGLVTNSSLSDHVGGLSSIYRLTLACQGASANGYIS
jgi:hypothetical protein